MRFLLLLILWPSLAIGQVIKVLDKTSQIPVENVAIYNTKESVLVNTNRLGEASLADFGLQELLIFRHPAYQQQILNKNDLQKLNYRIELSEKIIKIDEVIISANKWEQEEREVPTKIKVITPRQVSFGNPQTTADMLQQTGQIFMQKSQLGGGSPMIRGFAANSLLIVVDGVRMNNAIFRSGNLQNIIALDAQSMEGAEIIFGPGSVIYGSDALGGVMDFHTLQPNFKINNQVLSGNGMLRYSSANNERTAHVDFNLAGKNLASLTSLTFSNFDDLRTGSRRDAEFPDFGKRMQYVRVTPSGDEIVNNQEPNLQIPTGYDQFNLLQKIRYRPKNGVELAYAFHLSTSSNIPRYDRLIEKDAMGLPVNAEWYYGPQNWMMHQLTTTFYQPNRFFDDARVLLAYQSVEESRHDRKLYNDRLRHRTEKLDVFNFNMDFNKKLDEKQQLFYGVEAFYNYVNSSAYRENIVTGERTPTDTRYPSGGSTYSSMAAYSSYKWNINKKWIMNAGLRYSHVWLNAEALEPLDINLPFNELDSDNGSFNGNAGLVWLPTDDFKLDLLFSTGFRSPNVDDVGKVFEFTEDEIVIPNANLSPEYIYNSELSMRKKFAEWLQVDLTLFYAHLTDAIVRREVQFNGQDSLLIDGSWKNLQANLNAGAAFIRGISTFVKGKLTPHLVFGASLTYTDGKDLEKNEPLRHVAPMFGQVSLSYKIKKFETQAFMQYNGAITAANLPPSESVKTHLYTANGALAWQTYNWRMAYHFSPSISVNASVENLLDVHYRPYSSGISAAGRNFVVSISGHF